MKRKLLIIVIIILTLLSVLFIKLEIKFSNNNHYIENYNQANYTDTKLKKNLILNFYEGYIVDYNYGTYYYQTGNYEKASTYFEKAISDGIPKSRICKARVNYVLSEVKQITDDMTKVEKLAKITELKAYLSLNNCDKLFDDENDNGEDESEDGDSEEKQDEKEGKEAGSELSEELSELQEEVSKEPTEPGDDGEQEEDGDDGDNDSEPGKTEEEKDKLDELEERESEAEKERQDREITEANAGTPGSQLTPGEVEGNVW